MTAKVGNTVQSKTTYFYNEDGSINSSSKVSDNSSEIKSLIEYLDKMKIRRILTTSDDIEVYDREIIVSYGDYGESKFEFYSYDGNYTENINRIMTSDLIVSYGDNGEVKSYVSAANDLLEEYIYDSNDRLASTVLTVASVSTESIYNYVGSKLSSITSGDSELEYSYDDDGKVLGYMDINKISSQAYSVEFEWEKGACVAMTNVSQNLLGMKLGFGAASCR